MYGIQGIITPEVLQERERAAMAAEDAPPVRYEIQAKPPEYYALVEPDEFCERYDY